MSKEAKFKVGDLVMSTSDRAIIPEGGTFVITRVHEADDSEIYGRFYYTGIGAEAGVWQKLLKLVTANSTGKQISAGELTGADIGIEVRVPLENGSSVQDVLTEVFHASIPQRLDNSFETVYRAATFLRFEHLRPAFDPARDFNWPKKMDFLTEFFSVAPSIGVVVSTSSSSVPGDPS